MYHTTIHCVHIVSSVAKHALTKIAKGIVKVCKEDVCCSTLSCDSHLIVT